MKNLNPIYLLEISRETLRMAAKKTHNTLVKSGMSEKKALKNVSKRLNKMIDSKRDKLMSAYKLPQELKDKVINSPQHKRTHRNMATIMSLFR